MAAPTRKDLVLRFLERADRWVDGPELANEKVGGSEGLKRVRELRAEGHRIITRPHPDRSRDVFQYKLIKPESIAPVIRERLFAAAQMPSKPAEEPPAPETSPEPPRPSVSPGVAGREFIMRRTEDGTFELTREVCVECGGPYDDDLEHRTTDARHLRFLEFEQKRTAGQTDVGVPEQPAPYRFIEMPEKIEMGKVIPCPRCGGKRRIGRSYFSRKKGVVVVTESEDFTRDPFRPTIKGEPNRCIRCGGFGIIPQHIEEGDLVAPLREGDTDG